MVKKDLRIIFLGNPEFARFHLEKIVQAGYNVVAAITAPDKPAGRGKQLRATPVTEYARENNIPCLQPRNLKNEEFLDELKSYNANIQVVIAFRMLPVVVWDMPKYGTYNLHASLLPNYRGAAPINWAIINGETKTGVSTFKLKHEIDTGNLIVQTECEILPTDTAGILHDKLMVLGANAMLETLDLIVKDKVEEQPQQLLEESKPAPKLNTENCTVNWDQNGEDIVNFIRGLNPFPTATTRLFDKRIKLYGVRFSPLNSTSKPGEISTDGKSYLAVGCNNGVLFLEDIKMEGKKRLKIADLLNGFKLEPQGNQDLL